MLSRGPMRYPFYKMKDNTNSMAHQGSFEQYPILYLDFDLTPTSSMAHYMFYSSDRG